MKKALRWLFACRLSYADIPALVWFTCLMQHGHYWAGTAVFFIGGFIVTAVQYALGFRWRG